MRMVAIQKILDLHVALRRILIRNCLVEIWFSLSLRNREMVHCVSNLLYKLLLRKHVLNRKFVVLELVVRGLG